MLICNKKGRVFMELFLFLIGLLVNFIYSVLVDYLIFDVNV